MIARGLGVLAAHATALLFASLFVGVVLPDLAHLMRPLLTPCVIVMLSVSMMRIEWSEVVAYLRRPLLVATVALWIVVVSPVVMWAAARLFGAPPGLAAGLVLMATSPPIMGSVAMAFLLRLDVRLSLIMLVSCTLAIPLTMPLLANHLVRVELDITTPDFMGRLGLLVGGCLVLAAIGRRLLGGARIQAASKPLDGLLTLMLMIFAIGVMDGVTARLLAEPAHVMLYVAIAFAANLALQAAGGLATAALGNRAALTVAYCGGTRNFGILLAVLPAGADPDTFLFFGAAQPPIYMLPALMTPLYRRLLKD